mgnify:CR=1 FL=1
MVAVADRIASKYGKRVPSSVEKDDIKANARLGLVDAASKYDPSLGIPFEAYASLRIKGAILDGLRASDTLSRQARRTVKGLQAELKKDPNFAMPEDAPINPVHIDIDNKDLENLPLDELGVDERIDDRQKWNLIQAAIETLPPRLWDVFNLYTFEEMTLEEIGMALGVTQSRVSQLYKQAIKHLKDELADAIVARGER